MKTAKREQIDIYEIVNIEKEANEITMLDYLFDHKDGFKGATGTKFEAISKASYKEALSKDNVIERLIDCGLIPNHPKQLERKFAEVIYKELKANGELESFVFDSSYKEHWGKIRPYGYPVKDYPIFNCVGGGRCFDEDFQGNVNPTLSEKIRKYETASTTNDTKS